MLISYNFNHKLGEFHDIFRQRSWTAVCINTAINCVCEVWPFVNYNKGISDKKKKELILDKARCH